VAPFTDRATKGTPEQQGVAKRIESAIKFVEERDGYVGYFADTCIKGYTLAIVALTGQLVMVKREV
jgi:hypothetical protein